MSRPPARCRVCPACRLCDPAMCIRCRRPRRIITTITMRCIILTTMLTRCRPCLCIAMPRRTAAADIFSRKRGRFMEFGKAQGAVGALRLIHGREVRSLSQSLSVSKRCCIST